MVLKKNRKQKIRKYCRSSFGKLIGIVFGFGGNQLQSIFQIDSRDYQIDFTRLHSNKAKIYRKKTTKKRKKNLIQF